MTIKYRWTGFETATSASVQAVDAQIARGAPARATMSVPDRKAVRRDLDPITLKIY